MIQTLLKGFVFGLGFSVAVVVTGFVTVQLTELFQEEVPMAMKDDWRGLSDDEQIARASALVIGRYEAGPDSSRVGFVREIYVDSPGVGPELTINDQIPGSTYYPDKHDNRSGLVLLFVEGAEHPKSTFYMYDDRIPGFGDMPLDLLVKKFKADGA